jgi:hypothetical protein
LRAAPLKPDVEEEKQHADFAEDSARRLAAQTVHVSGAEQEAERVPENYTGDQLAEHGRLTCPLGQHTAEFGRQQQPAHDEQYRFCAHSWFIPISRTTSPTQSPAMKPT